MHPAAAASHLLRAAVGAAGIAVTASIAACGPSSDARQTASAAPVRCQATTDDAVGAAVADYVKQATPKPQRFLISAGTDSALGDAGLAALQEKGPTYLFPGDPALQATVRAQLHEKGDYTTLLVVRGAASKDGHAASVGLRGHFIGGEEDGHVAGARTYTLACDSTAWHVKSSEAGS